jgi:hypothetical protein
MATPSVYFDTSTVSAFWYEGADVAMLARRLKTHEWWDTERRHFKLWASDFGEAELEVGSFPRQIECLQMIRRLRFLRITADVHGVATKILDNGIVPRNKIADAGHLAVSAVHGVDYLLTWNYAHMANPIAQSKLDRMCLDLGLRAPLLVSPESIPQIRLGQAVRRG